MSIIRDYMNTKTYMVVTEVGYFLIHDALKKEIDEVMDGFKSKYNFSKIIDTIVEPFEQLNNELDEIGSLYEEGKMSSDDYDKMFDEVFDRIGEISRNAVSAVFIDPLD